GSTQVGLNANLLKRYRWWRFEPHPEWVTPRGTTLLEPRDDKKPLDLGDSSAADFPAGEGKAKGGNFRLPYAAGIPKEGRFLYIPPYDGVNFSMQPMTVLGLEPGVRYHAYYWEPTLGIKFDLGSVQRPVPGTLLREDRFEESKSLAWRNLDERKAAARE